MTLTNYKQANNATSTFASGISAGAGSFVCATGQGGRFPSTFPFMLTLEQSSGGAVVKREIVKCTNRAGDAFTITRSADNCLLSDTATTQTNTAQSFSAGDTISLRFTGGVVDDINAELVRLWTINEGVKSANIASATTTNLATATGDEIHITGTTTITGFGTMTAGITKKLIFDGVLTLTYNATSMILPTAASIITQAGDSGIFVSEGSGNWKCISYLRADGSPLKNFTGTMSQSSTEIFAVDTSGSSTAYVATLAPVPGSLTDGFTARIKMVNANTTSTPTLNINGLGAKTIVKLGWFALVPSDISANMYCVFVYDLTNTRWVLQSPTVNTQTVLYKTFGLSTNNANTSDNTVATYSVPANVLGTSRALRIKFNGSNPTAVWGNWPDIKIKYGGSTVCTLTFWQNAASNSFIFQAEVTIYANGATNSQVTKWCFDSSINTNGVIWTTALFLSDNDSQTSAIDSTAIQTLLLTSQYSSTTAAGAVTITDFTVELLN